jgi:hypothetical protein
MHSRMTHHILPLLSRRRNKDVTQTGVCVTEIAAETGELMRLVAAGLAQCGWGPGVAGIKNGRRLPITVPGAQCALTIDDSGLVVWEWHPAAGGAVDPRELAELACALLTGRVGRYPLLGDGYGPTITLKGAVGRELKARGLTVGLELYEDSLFFDVNAGIVASWPGGGQGAEVRVTDDGRLTWEYDCEVGAGAVLAGEPGDASRGIADPVAVAAGIVLTLAPAMSQALPDPARPWWSRLASRGPLAWFLAGWGWLA